MALGIRSVKSAQQLAGFACEPGCWLAGKGRNLWMKAAGPEAADVNPPAGLRPSIPANVLAPISPAHDVVHSTWALNAQLAGHDRVCEE